MGDKTFRAVLFCVLLFIFCATAAIVLLSLGEWIKIDPEYKRWLFTILIVEVLASMFAFWRQLTGAPFQDPPDVAGEWEYECIREDETYKHGGTATITLTKAPFGWEFLIGGMRTWSANKINGEWHRVRVEAPASWKNAWGTFTGPDALRYAYSVQVGKVLVQGYGWALIKQDRNGKMVLEGNFFQLPPHDPFYGFQRYTRKT